jgi:excisionase family DNA binding protein
MSLMDNGGIMTIMQHLACNARVDTKQPILTSKKDSAALLGVCLRTIDNLIATKQLPCRRIGRRVLIPYAAIVAFARRDHPVAAETAAGQGV